MDVASTLNLKQIIHLIKGKWLTILLIPIIFMSISVLVSFFLIPKQFEAKTTIIIGRTPVTDKEVQYDEILMYEKIVKTYSEIARSRLVAEKTLGRLNKNIPIEDFLSLTNVSQEPETQIMAIRVKSATAEDAMILTNTIAEVFIEECETLYPVASIQIIDKAYLPKAPINPNIKLNIVIALCFGIITATGVIFALNHFQQMVKTKNRLNSDFII